MPDIKLFYFDARGRAEVIRLLLALADQTYQDVRFTREEWPKYKAESPFGNAPFLEFNGKRYGQSSAIASFLAEEFSLSGRTNQDRLRVDEVGGLIQDLMEIIMKAYFEQDETKKAELNRKLTEEDLPRFCGHFQRLLQDNSPNGVFVGRELTLADLYVYDQMYQLKHLCHFDAAAKYTELKTLQDRVESHPRISKYLATRKNTPF